MDARDRALVGLGRELKSRGYRFTTITPASHRRVNARPGNEATDTLAGVFGWSRPFRRNALPQVIVELLAEAGVLETQGALARSAVRFSSLGTQLFVHSAFPTEQADAVFFGPDTYRFARALGQWLARRAIPSGARLIDIGCGSGAGGLYAASALAPNHSEIVLTDINARALRYARVNAAINAVSQITTVESDLFARVDGKADLIIANPPYLVDPQARLYRHGGGELGFDLSLRIVEEGVERLAPGGGLFLYTGTAVVDGTQKLFEALYGRPEGRDYSLTCEEIDPDVFGEELDSPPYDRADRIAAVAVMVEARRLGP
jgi:methylase of polypeptide subunit release factors